MQNDYEYFWLDMKAFVMVSYQFTKKQDQHQKSHAEKFCIKSFWTNRSNAIPILLNWLTHSLLDFSSVNHYAPKK